MYQNSNLFVFHFPWCVQEVACTARNLDSMLLTKNAALAMFAFELQLEGMQCYPTLTLSQTICNACILCSAWLPITLAFCVCSIREVVHAAKPFGDVLLIAHVVLTCCQSIHAVYLVAPPLRRPISWVPRAYICSPPLHDDVCHVQ